MNTSKKDVIIPLLRQRDYNRLVLLCEEDTALWKALRAILYETDENLFWPAIEAIGKLMRRWWDSGREERVREYIRNLLWSLNEESGGIGWNSPQAIAEIIAQVPELSEPYANVTISRALEEPLLVPSGLWVIGRLGPRARRAVDFSQDAILESFKRSQPQTLGLAAWATGEAGFKPALPFLEVIDTRKEPVRIWVGGHFEEKPLGQWASEAAERISKS